MRRSAALLVATAATAAVVAGVAPATAEPASVNNGDQVARTEVSANRIGRTGRPYGTNSTPGAEQYDGTRFVPSAPRRILDTRTGLGRGGNTAPVAGGTQIEVGIDSLPQQVAAVVLNVTGTESTANTHVTVWEGGTVPRPGVSNLNLTPGGTRANAVTTLVSLDHKINLHNNAGSTHLIADVAGYYVYDNPGTGTTPGRYFSVGPTRAYDSRNTGGAFRGGETRSIDFASAGVPAGATAVSLNVTGVDATADTHVIAWPAGSSRPTTSSLNVARGAITPNNVTVALSFDRRVNLYNNAGDLNLVVDIAGYYAPTESGGTDFYPFTPGRAFDTRETGRPIDPASELILLYLDSDLAPGQSLLLNLTGTEATANTHLTPFPAGESVPNTSVLNLTPGQTAPNMAAVRLGTAYDEWDNVYRPAHSFYNNAGSTHLIIDVFGIFA